MSNFTLARPQSFLFHLHSPPEVDARLPQGRKRIDTVAACALDDPGSRFA
jgi:hypothetical protein